MWAGSTTTRVALLGDSTLDNVCWVGEGLAIPELLQRCLSEGLRGTVAVRNLAADGFTSTNLLQGSRQVISVGIRRDLRVQDPVPFDEDGIFRPLDQLRKLAPPPTHIVLSIGGNDVREILRNMSLLPVVIPTFLRNYSEILSACLEVTPHVLPMLQYRPGFACDQDFYGVYHAVGAAATLTPMTRGYKPFPAPEDVAKNELMRCSSVGKLNFLMQECFRPIVDILRDHSLQVLDLPNSIDIFQDELFSHQIEPSHVGGIVISDALRHVMQQCTQGKPSTFYRFRRARDGQGLGGTLTFFEQENTQDLTSTWQVAVSDEELTAMEEEARRAR